MLVVVVRHFVLVVLCDPFFLCLYLQLREDSMQLQQLPQPLRHKGRER